MNDPRSTDRLLATWFESDAPTSAPEALKTDIHRATARIRPRPAWLARMRGTDMNVIEGGVGRRSPRLAPALVLLVLLLIALLAAVAVVGSRPPGDRLAAVPSVAPSGAPTSSATRAPSPSPSATPTPLADATIAFDYPVLEVIAGNDAMWVSVSGEDTHELPRTIHRIDPGTTTSTVVVDSIGADDRSPVSMVQANGSIWAVANAGNQMLRFDATSGRLVGTIPLGEFPIEPAVGFGFVWSENYRDGSVTKIDATTGKVAATITIAEFRGEGPRSIAAGEKLLWAVTPRQDVLVGIDPAKNRVVKTIDLAADLHCGVAAVGGRVWVASCDPKPLQVFDEATGAPQGVFGGAPGIGVPLFAADGVAWIPTGDDVPPLSTKLIGIDLATLQTSERPVVDLGVQAGGERWITVGHGSLWYATGNNVNRLSLDVFGSS